MAIGHAQFFVSVECAFITPSEPFCVTSAGAGFEKREFRPFSNLIVLWKAVAHWWLDVMVAAATITSTSPGAASTAAAMAGGFSINSRHSRAAHSCSRGCRYGLRHVLLHRLLNQQHEHIELQKTPVERLSFLGEAYSSDERAHSDSEGVTFGRLAPLDADATGQSEEGAFCSHAILIGQMTIPQSQAYPSDERTYPVWRVKASPSAVDRMSMLRELVKGQ